MNTNIQGTRTRAEPALAAFAPCDLATYGNTEGEPFLPEHTWNALAQTYTGVSTVLLVGCTSDFDEATQEACTCRQGDRVLIKDAPDARQNGLFYRYSADNEPWKLKRTRDANSALDLMTGRTVVVMRGWSSEAGQTFQLQALSEPTYTTELGIEVVPDGAFIRNGEPGVSYLYFG
jgi:hypothetical protein